MEFSNTNSTSNGARVVEALRTKFLSSRLTYSQQSPALRLESAMCAAEGIFELSRVTGGSEVSEGAFQAVHSFYSECISMNGALIGGLQS